MGKKPQNAPVYFTLAQVRFNPVLSLDTYLTSLQESFRKAGFPDFKQQTIQAINLMTLGEAGATQLSPPQREVHYQFADMAGKTKFAVGHNHITFETVEYDVFEALSEQFKTGLELLHGAVRLDYYDRIGFRTLDAVAPRTDETLDQYLVPHVLGIAGYMDGASPIYSFSETRVNTVPGEVLARVVIQNSQVGFPPDLNPLSLQIAERFRKIDGLHAVLDTDAFFEGREPFDPGRILERLKMLHDEAAKLFRLTVTDHAIEAWT